MTTSFWVVMERIIRANELRFNEDVRHNFSIKHTEVSDYVCEAAYNMYLNLEKTEQKAVGFIVFTTTGKTARLMSRYRPNVPIYAVVPSEKQADMLTANYAVEPIAHYQPYTKELTNSQKMNEIVKDICQKDNPQPGSWYILLYGETWMVKGGTSILKMVQV